MGFDLAYDRTNLLEYGNVGAKVGQDHATVRHGRETGQLEYGNALQSRTGFILFTGMII